MNTTGDDGDLHEGAECRPEDRARAAWHGAVFLDGDERRRIDAHAAGCRPCAETARFSREFGSFLREKAGPHPDAGTLVAFAEDPSGMTPGAHARVSLHVAACDDCGRELELLRRLDEPATGAAARDGAAPAGLRSALRGFVEACGRTLLGPTAAAAYLTVALVAIGTLTLQRPGERVPEATRIREQGPAPDPAGAGGTRTGTRVEEVIIVGDAGGVSRGGNAAEDGREVDDVIVPGDRDAHLVLEFTALEAPPDPAAAYRVRVTSLGGSAPAWDQEVAGVSFADSYSLLLILPARTLAPGRYRVEVSQAIGGATLYRAHIRVP